MYFDSRAEAGQILADKLQPEFEGKDCVIISLSDGSVLIGAIIAARLRAALTLLLTAQIMIPQEPDPIAMIDERGGFTYNHLFSAGVLEDLVSEYRSYIEEEKLNQLHRMTRLLGGRGLVKRDLLRNKHIILVSDGLTSGFSLEAANGFLKPVPTGKIVIATPVASIPAMDRMHLLTDEICCLNIPDNYVSTDHYYKEKDVIDHERLISTIREIDSHWI